MEVEGGVDIWTEGDDTTGPSPKLNSGAGVSPSSLLVDSFQPKRIGGAQIRWKFVRGKDMP